MKELKCPKCGNVFSVDEAGYAEIASQVRNAEFQQEVERRLSELQEKQKAELEAQELKSRQDYDRALSAKDLEAKEKDAEIERLKMQLGSMAQSEQLKYTRQLAEKEKEITNLKNQVSQHEQEVKVAVLEEQSKAKDEIQAKDVVIAKLKNQAAADKAEAIGNEQRLKEKYETELKHMQAQVDLYKDMKTRLSTKMVGETLETHCSAQFNTMVRPIMPNAYFEKDNDASGGSKGDFIFRDSIDGFEYISIMFEMKNEMDATATKHKNEDFLKKLDADRKAKNCEYAVLVSLLELDSEQYNAGIVDMSYRYPKMYVIRPQFFIPIISLLVQTSHKSVELQRQLELAKQQSVDVTNFETRLGEFKDKFGRNYRLASEKFAKAIEEIDKSINHLQKIKANLVGSENSLRLANQNAEDLTIKKLTRGNPTMKAKFDEARQAASSATPDDGKSPEDEE